MLTSNEYNKAKLLHQLSCILWFIKKHGLEDAKTASDTTFEKLLEDIMKDINKHMPKVQDSLC